MWFQSLLLFNWFFILMNSIWFQLLLLWRWSFTLLNSIWIQRLLLVARSFALFKSISVSCYLHGPLLCSRVSASPAICTALNSVQEY